MQLAPIQGGQRVAFEGEAPSFLARVDFDLRACGKWAVPVRYRVADKIVSGRGKEVRFTIRRGDGKQQYFFTVHDDAQTAFDGLMLRADDVRCLTGAYRVEPLAEPFLYHMLIDGRWRPLGSFRF